MNLHPFRALPFFLLVIFLPTAGYPASPVSAYSVLSSKSDFTQTVYSLPFSLPVNNSSESPPPPITPDSRDWPVSTPEEQGMNSRLLAAMLADLRSSDSHLHSLLIVRHGHLVLEAYFDPFFAAVPHSCTKSITSTLLGIAIDEGLLPDVDVPLAPYFPDVKMDDLVKETITAEHFLAMSSGMAWDEWSESYRSPNNMLTAMLYEEDQAAYVFSQPLVSRPGEQFSYHSGGSHLLSLLISRLSGMNSRQYARLHLFSPLGINEPVWEETAGGDSVGATGLQLLPRDMAKFGQLYLQGGEWQGENIISGEWVETSTRPHIHVSPGVDYGYQWWLPQGKGFLASGWGQQTIWVLPGQDMVLVVTAGMKNDSWLPHASLLEEYILPAVLAEGALPPDMQGEAMLAAEVRLAAQPEAQQAPTLSSAARQVKGKTWLVTGSSILTGLDTFTITGYSAGVMHLQAGLMGEEVELQAGMDGVYRSSDINNGELALKAAWQDDGSLQLIWQNLSSAEQIVLRIDFQEDEFSMHAEEYIGEYIEESQGVLLEHVE